MEPNKVLKNNLERRDFTSYSNQIKKDYISKVFN